MDQPKITAQEAWSNLSANPTPENLTILLERMRKEGKTYKNIDGMDKAFANKYFYGKKMKDEVLQIQLKRDVPKIKPSGTKAKTENQQPSEENSEQQLAVQNHEAGVSTS
jgi:hypothetical protein